MFKKGDKVVYVGWSSDSTMILPEINTEVLTIKGICDVWPDSYDIEGYETTVDGRPQSFHKTNLRKVSDINDSREWAEKTLEKIETEAEKEAVCS